MNVEGNKVWDVGEGGWKQTLEIVGREIEMGEVAAGGDGGGDGGIEGVVVEGNGGEGRETAENGGEWAGEGGGREVDGSDGGGVAAGDAGPVAWIVVVGVPVGENSGGVGEGGFYLD